MEYVTLNTELMSKAVDMMPDTIKGSNYQKKVTFLDYNAPRPLVLSIEQLPI